LATLESIGVGKLINAAGPETIYGGSSLVMEVVEAMSKVSPYFVDMYELLQKASARAAEILNVEAAFITAGAATALVVATAACMTGTDRNKVRRLPNVEGLKNEVIIQRGHRYLFDQAFRLSGARFVEIGFPFASDASEVAASIGEKTAALAYDYDQKGIMSLEEFSKVGRENGIPVIVDAADMMPPLANIKKYAASADLVCTSGGKALRGPNDTGIVCGKRELIEACALNAFPNYAIGRPMKVSKEQIIGLVTALERYAARDEKIEVETWTRRLQRIAELLKDVNKVEARVVFPDEVGRPVPRLHIRPIAPDAPKALEITERLKEKSPKIMTLDLLTQLFPNTVIIDPTTMAAGEEEIVGTRLLEILNS